MENNELQVTLGDLINRFDALNSKLDETKKESKDTASQTTSLNTSFSVMNDAIKNLGSSVPSVTSAFQLYKTVQTQVNLACKAFAANPVGAVLQVIATVLSVVNTAIDKLKSRISASDEMSAKWAKTMSILEPIFQGFNFVLDKITDSIVDFIGNVMSAVEWLGSLADKLAKYFGIDLGIGFTKAAEKAKEFADLEREIQEEELTRIRERGASEAKQAQLREQIASAEGEQKNQLIKQLQEEIRLQTDAEIALNNKKIALMEYQQSLSATSYEERKQLEELKAQNDKFAADRDLQLARLKKQLKEIPETVEETAEEIKTIFDTELSPENLEGTFMGAFEERMKQGTEILKANIKEQVQALKAEAKAAEETKKTTMAVARAMDSAIQSSISMINQMISAKQNQLEQDVKNGKITEEQAKKEFEHNKKVQIAMATVQMLSGISMAIANAMQLGPIAGPIVGAINAAMVSASGALQIANIKKTKLESAGSTGSESPTAGGLSVSSISGSVSPLLDAEFDAATISQSAATQGASATTDQRVYILEDDIQSSNKRVSVRENNTTF